MRRLVKVVRSLTTRARSVPRQRGLGGVAGECGPGVGAPTGIGSSGVRGAVLCPSRSGRLSLDGPPPPVVVGRSALPQTVEGAVHGWWLVVVGVYGGAVLCSLSIYLSLLLLLLLSSCWWMVWWKEGWDGMGGRGMQPGMVAIIG